MKVSLVDMLVAVAYLLGHHTQYLQLYAVELIKACPCTTGSQAFEELALWCGNKATSRSSHKPVTHGSSLCSGTTSDGARSTPN
jgi:hypothetical protein